MIDFDTVVPRQHTDSLKWDRYKGRDILPFWVADMDFEVAEPIQKALEARLRHRVHGYGVAPSGLADAVIDHLQREHDWQIASDWITWLPGVVTGLAVSCRAFCADGDEIIVNPPIYHHFFHSHDVSRQTLVQVPLHKADGRWTYSIDAIRDACHQRTRLIMMCSPHNPTGTVFRQAELQALAELCQEHDTIMVSDEIHSDLVIDKNARHTPTAKACPEMSDRIITLMSGSKTWNLAGLNCSFAIISDPDLRRQFRRACHSIVPPVPPLAFTATLAAYRDGGRWRSELLSYLAENLACIRAALDDVPELALQPMQATYLAWIDATKLDLEDTQGFFESHGVGLSSGEQFGQSQFLRMNFACPRSVLQEGLERMRSAVKVLAEQRCSSA